MKEAQFFYGIPAIYTLARAKEKKKIAKEKRLEFFWEIFNIYLTYPGQEFTCQGLQEPQSSRNTLQNNFPLFAYPSNLADNGCSLT